MNDAAHVTADQVVRALDREAAAAEERAVLAHVEHCPACFARFAAEIEAAALAALPVRRTRALPWGSLAAAAALLALATLGLLSGGAVSPPAASPAAGDLTVHTLVFYRTREQPGEVQREIFSRTPDGRVEYRREHVSQSSAALGAVTHTRTTTLGPKGG